MVQEDEHRKIFPQFAVLGFSIGAIVVGSVLWTLYRHLTLGAFLANVVWASINLGLAGAVVRFTLGKKHRRNEYRFPLAPFGQYRLVIEPVAPYTAPSTATRAQLAGLTRPDGQPLLIVDASFGGAFALASPSPVRVDVPIDRPGLTVALSKTVSRARAVPGDAVF